MVGTKAALFSGNFLKKLDAPIVRDHAEIRNNSASRKFL